MNKKSISEICGTHRFLHIALEHLHDSRIYLKCETKCEFLLSKGYGASLTSSITQLCCICGSSLT